MATYLLKRNCQILASKEIPSAKINPSMKGIIAINFIESLLWMNAVSNLLCDIAGINIVFE